MRSRRAERSAPGEQAEGGADAEQADQRDAGSRWAQRRSGGLAQQQRQQRQQRAGRKGSRTRTAPRPRASRARRDSVRAPRARARRARAPDWRSARACISRASPVACRAPRRSGPAPRLPLPGYSSSSARSRPIWYSYISRCERTETYSPAAIDSAPASRPAMPLMSDDVAVGAAPATPSDQAGVGDQAVVDAEDRGPQIVAAATPRWRSPTSLSEVGIVAGRPPPGRRSTPTGRAASSRSGRRAAAAARSRRTSRATMRARRRGSKWPAGAAAPPSAGLVLGCAASDSNSCRCAGSGLAFRPRSDTARRTRVRGTSCPALTCILDTLPNATGAGQSCRSTSWTGAAASPGAAGRSPARRPR